MTKLEEKLNELGYEYDETTTNRVRYYKLTNGNTLAIILKINSKSIFNAYAFINGLVFYSQQDIDNLQQAFNTLQ